ncbi:MAG: hypothetical protein HY515_01690 [Candidatus Aenigmarchaeota archaeon]|nr:hypothetical protein [Candidatus Aenigmarchaeota archaeon]
MFKIKNSLGLIGWYGAFAIVLAYSLISFSLVKSDNILYQLLNLTGAISLLAETMSKKDYQPAAINVVWIIISILALVKILF